MMLSTLSTGRVVVAIQALFDFPIGGDHQANGVSQKSAQLVGHRQVLRFRSGDREFVVFESHGDHPIQLGHGIADQAERAGGDLRFGQVDHLQSHLLGQRLDQLVVGDQPHLFGDLAELLTRLLELLFEQHFQLIVVDKAQVDENLPDPTNRHKLSSASGI